MNRRICGRFTDGAVLYLQDGAYWVIIKDGQEVCREAAGWRAKTRMIYRYLLGRETVEYKGEK